MSVTLNTAQKPLYRQRFVIAALAVATLAGCDPQGGSGLFGGHSTRAMMPNAAEGEALFKTQCAVCHGEAGQGDGSLAAGLDPRPADLTQISARNAGVFPRTAVLSALDGYGRGETHATAMPEFGALLEGDTVPVMLEDGTMSPVPRPLAALMFYVESLQE